MSKTNKKDSKPSRKIEKARLESKIESFIENGRSEITTKKQLEKYPIGSLISYMTNSNIFKLGGFIVKFANDYFIYITPDFKTKYRARYKNIKKMWAGDVYEVKNDLISFVKTSQKKTNFEIRVNDIIIFYARSSFDARRFKCTEKYKRLVLWNDYFNN